MMKEGMMDGYQPFLRGAAGHGHYPNIAVVRTSHGEGGYMVWNSSTARHRQWSAAHGRFPLSRGRRCLALAGLDHIHRRGLLHKTSPLTTSANTTPRSPRRHDHRSASPRTSIRR
jgi:hypothetical protein